MGVILGVVEELGMSYSNQRSREELAPAEEPQVEGSVVAFRGDIVTGPAPSPARELQHILARHAAANDLYIADPAARRVALLKFVGTATLLWGGMAATITMLMIASH